MKRLLTALIILLMVASAGFAQARTYRIGVSMPSATHGWMGERELVGQAAPRRTGKSATAA